MLSALVQSEAAIVALVVTLSLVAVQLAAQSYSARVIEVFRRTPDLWILMGIYGIAIFYGLGVLKMIERANPQLCAKEYICLSNLEGNILGAYYLGVFAFVALVPYIWNTLEMLMPSTVIDKLAERISKESILLAVGKDISEEVKIEKDPIQPIIDIVRGSLMKHDYETVRYGLRIIRDQTNSLFEKETLVGEQEEKIALHIFSHLIRVGKLAAIKKDEDSTRQVIVTLHENGEVAVKQELKGTLHWAVFFLGELGNEAAKQELERATMGAVIYIGELGKEAAKQESEDITTEAADSLKKILIIAKERNLIKIIPEAEKYYTILNEALNKLKKKRTSEWDALL